jgi:hypothetical protein
MLCPARLISWSRRFDTTLPRRACVLFFQELHVGQREWQVRVGSKLHRSSAMAQLIVCRKKCWSASASVVHCANFIRAAKTAPRAAHEQMNRAKMNFSKAAIVGAFMLTVSTAAQSSEIASAIQNACWKAVQGGNSTVQTGTDSICKCVSDNVLREFSTAEI